MSDATTTTLRTTATDLHGADVEAGSLRPHVTEEVMVRRARRVAVLCAGDQS